MGSCVICDLKTSGSLEFCQKHFKEHKEDIILKKPWVKVLKNDSQRERRRQLREAENTSLDAIMDKQFERNRY